MKVVTNFGIVDIDPATVISIRTGNVIPEQYDFCDLTHFVEFKYRFDPLNHFEVAISRGDARRLSEISGRELKVNARIMI